MDPTLIRQAAPPDANAIAEVHMTARREAMPYLPEVHTAEETRAWVAEIVLPAQSVWVAETDGQVVGVAACEEGTLEQLYILPDHQGQGIGSALLAAAKELNPAGLSLWTFQRNASARAFYEHRGFTPVEFTDGSTNEEREPDVRYEWTPAQPSAT
ncbi:MAG: GNAT family N-acetyltransferase [Thermomicrobiales bacterium]